MNGEKKQANPIRALIFDLGKVVFDFSFDAALTSWAQAAGLHVDELSARLVWDGSYERYERGEIDLKQVHRRFTGMISAAIDYERFESAWLGVFGAEIPGIRSLLRRLQPDYRLTALSNTNADHARVWRRLYPEALSCFEKVFASHEITARKPEARAYEAVLDYLGLPAGQTLFIDDMADNIAAADRLGLKVVLFENCAQLEVELRRLGIFNDRPSGQKPPLATDRRPS